MNNNNNTNPSTIFFQILAFLAFWTWLIKAELSTWGVEITYVKSFVFSVFAQIVLIIVAIVDMKVLKVFQFIMIFVIFFCLGRFIWGCF